MYRVTSTKKLGLFLGPLAFVLIYFVLEIPGLDDAPKAVLASAAWIAIWWITESVPLAVAALLPIILFPLTGAMDIKSTCSPYSHPFIYLYLGGFFIAIAIEKCNLHKRIALNIIRVIGTNVIYIILGFMVATAFLSMWISNTASAVMLLPVGMAIVKQLRDNPDTIEDENAIFGKALMLAIAYSASIGGMATLIGTPPNLVMAGIVKETYGITITFSQWFVFGFPLSVLLLFICWYYLTHIAFRFSQKSFPGGTAEIYRQLSLLGKMTKDEKRVAIVFFTTAFAWITKSFLLVKIIPAIDDTIIAIMGGISLFLIPAENKKSTILEWRDTVKVPWGIVILFGGGMSLAAGFENSGLATWIGDQFTYLDGISIFLLVLIVVGSVNMLTEFTSNLATTAMLLPVLIVVAASANVSPYYLVISATLAASCAFMLPVATPPNAVVFGSGYLKIGDMVRIGFWLNVMSTIIVTLAVYYLLPILWDMDVFQK
ncbi:MAG: DASS family sodium-coupled anion symporter [Saprospiraceae bacterium]|nr:DASS family sodium-coupled anion symporter [Saprospiraceae bacterium]